VRRSRTISASKNLYDPVNTPLVSFLNNAIKAKELYKKDKDYVVVTARS